MEQFQPMMTSETVKDVKSQYKVGRSVRLRHNRRQAKRECEEEWNDENSIIVKKRDRKESDYGSLGSLGSELLKLDIEQDPKVEVMMRTIKVKANNIELWQSKYREGSSKLLSDCLTFRRTMTQLRKQTLNLVKVQEWRRFMYINITFRILTTPRREWRRVSWTQRS